LLKVQNLVKNLNLVENSKFGQNRYFAENLKFSQKPIFCCQFKSWSKIHLLLKKLKFGKKLIFFLTLQNLVKN